MRTVALTALLTTLLAGPAGCAGAAAAPRAGAADAAADPARHVVRGEYVFTVTPGTTARSLQGALADLAPGRVRAVAADRFVVTFADDPGLTRLGFRVGSGQILAVQPNYVYRTRP